MGRRGPPPKPTPLRKLTGNASKRRLNEREPPAGEEGEISRPRWLRGRTRGAAIWVELSDRLSAMKVLTPADELALGVLCAEFADYLDSRDQVREEGRTYESVRYSMEEIIDAEKDEAAGEPQKAKVARRIMRAHPLLTIQAARRTWIRGMMQEFGLTPSARSRVVGGEKQAEGDDFASKYLSGNTGA